MRKISQFGLFLLMPFLIVAQNNELKKYCQEVEFYASEMNNLLNEFQDNIKKAQNSTYTQDISLYLDIAFSSFQILTSDLKYAQDSYSEMFKLLEKQEWTDFSLIAGKAYNESILTENEFSRIFSTADEISGMNELMQIQQRLSAIRNSGDDALYHLFQLKKFNKQLLDLISSKEVEENKTE